MLVRYTGTGEEEPRRLGVTADPADPEAGQGWT